MELIQLTTVHERNIFGKCLLKARTSRGAGFRETAQSRLGGSHLEFGGVYAILENFGEPLEAMVGGFIMHSLATLPQSLPKPDLSEFPPGSVLEGSDLWSLSSGVAKVAAAGAALVASLMQAKAILVYPIVSPMDLTGAYGQFRFDKACEPLRMPYGETLRGEDIWVQPLILRGEKLEAYIRWGCDVLFRGGSDRLTLRFDKPSSPRPSADIAAAALANAEKANGAVAP